MRDSQFYFEQADQSIRLAQTSPNRKLKRMWLEQASTELERAFEARQREQAHAYAG